MDNIVKVDFGKQERESSRKLQRLLNIVSKHEEEFLNDPRLLLNAANDEICRLRRKLSDLKNSAYPIFKMIPNTGPIRNQMETIQITKPDYECLNNMRKILDLQYSKRRLD